MPGRGESVLATTGGGTRKQPRHASRWSAADQFASAVRQVNESTKRRCRRSPGGAFVFLTGCEAAPCGTTHGHHYRKRKPVPEQHGRYRLPNQAVSSEEASNALFFDQAVSLHALINIMLSAVQLSGSTEATINSLWLASVYNVLAVGEL
jgi:hypothetical protein